MSVARDVDVIVNLLGFAAVVWMFVATIVRWIHRRRIESYSADALLPKGFPRWMRWFLALTFVIYPAPPEKESWTQRPTKWGVTPWGWLCVGCVAVWLVVKVIA